MNYSDIAIKIVCRVTRVSPYALLCEKRNEKIVTARYIVSMLLLPYCSYAEIRKTLNRKHPYLTKSRVEEIKSYVLTSNREVYDRCLIQFEREISARVDSAQDRCKILSYELYNIFTNKISAIEIEAAKDLIRKLERDIELVEIILYTKKNKTY